MEVILVGAEVTLHKKPLCGGDFTMIFLLLLNFCYGTHTFVTANRGLRVHFWRQNGPISSRYGDIGAPWIAGL